MVLVCSAVFTSACSLPQQHLNNTYTYSYQLLYSTDIVLSTIIDRYFVKLKYVALKLFQQISKKGAAVFSACCKEKYETGNNASTTAYRIYII